MSLKDIALAARRRWVLVVALSVVGLFVGLSIGLLSSAQYAARSFVYVAGQPSGDGSGAYEGALLAEQKARAYSEIVSGGSFATRIAASVGGDPAEVAEQISVSTQADSSLIEVVASDPSPQRAAILADAGAAGMVALVGGLERPTPDRPSTVTAVAVEPATVPIQPVGIGTSTCAVLGLVFGLLAGLAIAVLWSVLDTTVEDSLELATLVDAPILGAVPRDAGSEHLITDLDRSSPVAESLRQIRTSLGFVSLAGEISTLMVTSAVEGEGKSTTAAGLAVVLAQQGRQVVVVDADLRRPHLTDLFGLPGEVGLTNVLLGQVSLDVALQAGADGQVAVLGRGTEPPNPADLLTSPALAALLRRLAERFDLVVLDTPPLLAVADAAILAPQCDGVIMVVRAERTTSRAIAQASQRLRDASARHIGCVLTMGRSKVEGYRTYGQANSPRPPVAAQAKNVSTASEQQPRPAGQERPRPRPQPTGLPNSVDWMGPADPVGAPDPVDVSIPPSTGESSDTVEEPEHLESADAPETTETTDSPWQATTQQPSVVSPSGS